MALTNKLDVARLGYNFKIAKLISCDLTATSATGQTLHNVTCRFSENLVF